MLVLLVAAPALLPGLPIRVWDNVLSPAQLSSVVAAGESRKHSFTSVFDRNTSPAGRTIIESVLTALLDEMGDSTRFVEYWWRGEHKDMAVHRDVDEAICRSRKHAGTGMGVQRCPETGHVLYLDIAPGLRGPTCVWDEEEPSEAWAALAVGADADARAGAPRSLRRLNVVPAAPGRLLRFRGDLLHAVPKPALGWLSDRAAPPPSAPSSSNPLRQVLLFNLWSAPPMLPSADDPPPNQAAAALAALARPPGCVPRGEWVERSPGLPESAYPSLTRRRTAVPARFAAPLLGEALRRGCDADSLHASAPAAELRTALLSNDAWSSVTVEDLGAAEREHAGAGARAGAGAGAGAVSDEAEELELKLGYAEHVESQFWAEPHEEQGRPGEAEGEGDEADEDDEGEDTMEDGGVFWEKVRALQVRRDH